MTDSNRRISHAALVAALISSPVFAASDPAAIEQQLNALQQTLARQQAVDVARLNLPAPAAFCPSDRHRRRRRAACRSARTSPATGCGRSVVSDRCTAWGTR